MAPRARNALHLLWTVPLATVAALPFFFYGSISVCGISGCSGAGYGVHYGPDWIWVSLLLMIGVVYVLAIGAVPWAPRGRRWLVAALVGLLIAGSLIVSFAWAKYQSMQ